MVPERLIEQARHLATRDVQGRPRQDNLRRAVSTAYYALFHFLVEQACRSFVGAADGRKSLRAVLARAFDHAGMKRSAGGFAAGALPARLVPALPTGQIPVGLRTIAADFRILQEQRHMADYDRLQRFSRRTVLDLVDQAENAIQSWPSISQSDAARLFLVALLVGERIRE